MIQERKKKSFDFSLIIIGIAVIALLTLAVKSASHEVEKVSHVASQQDQWVKEHGPRLLKILRGEQNVQKAILLCGLEVGQLCPGDCARRFHVDAPDAPFGKLKD